MYVIRHRKRETEITPPDFKKLYDDDYEAYTALQNYYFARHDIQQFIDRFVADLQGVKPSVRPVYNRNLSKLVSGRVLLRPERQSIEIGSGYLRDSELFKTIFHEEMHVRLYLRARESSLRAKKIISDIDVEEEYVENVALRYFRFYVRQYGKFEH